jgi:uncharacterized protein YggE
MKKMMILFACMMTTLWTFAQGEKNFLDQNYIEVNGKAEMEVTPDLIYLGITINERDSKNKTPIAESEKQMIDKLKSLGIDVGKDLLIKDLASTFKFNLQNRNPVIKRISVAGAQWQPGGQGISGVGEGRYLQCAGGETGSLTHG